MYMASTILNFPDGSKEERRVISHFEVDGLNTLVFDMNKELNGNHCTHVSYLSPEGRYQNVIEPEKWDKCKEILVKALHGQAKENYRPVPAEISVTADPSRELYLRPANYMPLVENYENYLLECEKKPLGNETPIVNASEISAIVPDNTIAADVQEVKIVDENTPNNDITEIPNMSSIPMEGTMVDNSNNDLNTLGLGNNMGIIPEMSSTPVIEQDVATPNPTDNTVPFPEPIMPTNINTVSQVSVTPEIGNSVVNETPIISEIPSAPVIEQTVSSSNNSENSIPFPEPIMSTDINTANQVSDTPEVGNSVMNETPIIPEIPSIPEQPVVPSNTTDNIVPFSEPIVPEDINTTSQVSVTPEIGNSVVNETPIIPEMPSIPEQPVAPSNTTDNIVPFPEPIMPTNINTASQVSVTPAVGNSVVNETPIISEMPSASVTIQTPSSEVKSNSEENKSIVTDSYLGNANQIIESMKVASQEHKEKRKALDEEYHQRYKELDEEYLATLNQMKQQMVEHLKEAKDYGDILKGKFEAQNNREQEGPSLQRAA